MILQFVAHAPTRAASTLMSMPVELSDRRRDESRRGTHECVRHGNDLVARPWGVGHSGTQIMSSKSFLYKLEGALPVATDGGTEASILANR